MKTQILSQEHKPLSETQIIEFQRILKVLNNYYAMFSAKENKPKSEGVIFREKLEKITVDKSVVVSIAKLQNYTYHIKAYIGQEHSEWVHVDGIQEERDELTEKNVTDHPVFKITCLTDLYRGE